jgi:anti-sigma regulatory factor (Ser/Thr protein kinase)
VPYLLGAHMQGPREPDSQRAHADDAAGLRWWRIFPGEGGQLRELRQWLKDLLPDCGARDDVILVADELAANAVNHTASGRGGQFSVEVTVAGGLLRVTVGDGGGPSAPVIIEDPMSEHGRGLRLVHALSADMGVSGGERGRFVHAALEWTGPFPAKPEGGHGGVVHLRVLQGQFPQVPVWFGLATRRWWALVVTGGEHRLIATGSPGELAEVLTAVCRVIPAGAQAGTARQLAAAPFRGPAEFAEAATS